MGTDDFEDPSRLTSDVVQWFARSVRARVTAPPLSGAQAKGLAGKAQPYIESGLVTVDDLVQWFVERVATYAVWQDSLDYYGAGFAAGSWSVDWDALTADLLNAVEASQITTARDRDATLYHDLDSWLRADLAGALAYQGAIGGSRLLNEDVQARLSTAAIKRRKRLRRMTPRTCVCGETFTPARFDGKHCAKCLANARAMRKQGRQQP
jgi:hypothetical protein